MPPRVTACVANEKGGQCKTTTTAAFGHQFARARERTVVIDMDPQGNLTQHLLGRADSGQGLLELLTGRRATLSELLVPVPTVEGLWLVPSGRAVERAQDEARLLAAGGQLALARHIPKLDADVVVIDTPPKLKHLLNVALAASDVVIVPVELESAAVKGIVGLTQTIAEMSLINPRLDLLGILPSKVKLTRTDSRDVLAYLQETYGRYVFSSMVRDRAAVAGADKRMLPPTAYKPSGEGAQDFVRAFHELEARIAEAA